MSPIIPDADPASTRNRILDSAERIVVAAGASRMTLDAVVQEAGVSKGGLLYHFPNKDALLAAMVDRYCGSFNEALEKKMAGRPDTLPNHVDALIDSHLEMGAAKPRELTASLLAASASNPDLLASPRDSQREHLAHMAQLPGDFPLALVVLSAIDGLALGDMLGLSALSSQQREQLIAKLRELTRNCGR